MSICRVFSCVVGRGCLLLPIHSLVKSLLVRWFLKCQCSVLPSPVWPLPICLASWASHSRFLCNIAPYSIGLCFYHKSQPQLSIFFFFFCFGSVSSFFLKLFLHWSPVAYRTPNDLGTSSFGILSFCLFILFMGFSRQEYWSGLPFPFPLDHILSIDMYNKKKN